MALFGFKRRFVEPILAGTKDQTIRAVRKVPVRLHQVMHLYTGLRQPGAKLIGRVLCVDILPILMLPKQGGYVMLYRDGNLETVVNAMHDLDAFARRDGFASWAELCAFWRETHGEDVGEFEGHVYRWDPRSIPR